MSTSDQSQKSVAKISENNIPSQLEARKLHQLKKSASEANLKCQEKQSFQFCFLGSVQNQRDLRADRQIMNLVFSRKTRINIGSTEAITAAKSQNKHRSTASTAIARVTTLVVALPEIPEQQQQRHWIINARAWQHPV